MQPASGSGPSSGAARHLLPVGEGTKLGDVLIHALPLYHTHGLFVALNLMLMNGGRVILLPRFEPETVIGLMARASVLMGVPTFYTRLLASPRLSRSACAPMRLFVSGSAPLLATTHAAFEARTGRRVLERYGMTETGGTVANSQKSQWIASLFDALADPAEIASLVLGRLEVTGAEARDLWQGKRLAGAAVRMQGARAAAVAPDGALVGVVERRGSDLKSVMNRPAPSSTTTAEEQP